MMSSYIIEIETDITLADWEIDELRQNTADFLSTDEEITVTISEVD